MHCPYDHHGFYNCMCAHGEGFCDRIPLSENEREKFTAEDAEPFSFYIYEGVTGVASGELDNFHGLKELRIADTVTEIGVSPELEAIMRSNRTLIRGSFGSYAEGFAKKYGLPFLHDDIELGRHRGEYDSYIITLRFHADGRPYIEQNCITGGISAGSNGGCEKRGDLPMDFYRKMNPEDIADRCIGCCYSRIKSNKRLAVFLKNANARNGYYFQ